jgi:hypothetical protein
MNGREKAAEYELLVGLAIAEQLTLTSNLTLLPKNVRHLAFRAAAVALSPAADSLLIEPATDKKSSNLPPRPSTSNYFMDNSLYTGISNKRDSKSSNSEEAEESSRDGHDDIFLKITKHEDEILRIQKARHTNGKLNLDSLTIKNLYRHWYSISSMRLKVVASVSRIILNPV